MTTAMGKRATSQTTGNGAATGYEAELWSIAAALHGSMDSADYKHIVLGLILLNYISDAFEARHLQVLAECRADTWAMPAGGGGGIRTHVTFR